MHVCPLICNSTICHWLYSAHQGAVEQSCTRVLSDRSPRSNELCSEAPMHTQNALRCSCLVRLPFPTMQGALTRRTTVTTDNWMTNYPP